MEIDEYFLYFAKKQMKKGLAAENKENLPQH